jgi:hypothetical protein
MRKYHIIPLVVVFLLGAHAVAFGQGEEKIFIPSISGGIAVAPTAATEEEQPTPTATSTETSEATATNTPTSTSTATNTPTPTATETSWIVPCTLAQPDAATCTTTPTSTSTPTSTPTTTATASPTPSPTTTAGENGKITVLDNHLSYVSSTGSLHIVGEVQNNTGIRAAFVKVTVNLFNAQHQLVDTDFTYVDLDPLPVGETTCFDILFFAEAPSFSYYTFETSYSETSQASLPIALFGHSGSYHETFEDWYEVVGIARNDSGVNAEFVKIIGTLYQHNGQVLDCDFTFTNSDVLAPNQESSWEISFLHAPAGSVASYRVQAQGREELVAR